MSAVSFCPRCNNTRFRHPSIDSTCGHYAVNCPNGHNLLRCTSCTYVSDWNREDNMIRHIRLRHAINDVENDTAAADVIFDNVQPEVDNIDNEDGDNAATSDSTSIGNGTIYSIPSNPKRS